MKKGYSKPLTEIELNATLQVSILGGSGGNTQALDDRFDPSGLSNAGLVGNSPRLSLQNRASNLWDEDED